MKKEYIFFSMLILVLISCQEAEQNDKALEHRPAVEYVDPMIGTGGHGHTYPGASSPFGMVQLSPDTRMEGWDGCGGYHYSDSIIFGFSHTHLSGTGVPDYADLRLMPLTGKIEFTETEDGLPQYRSSFAHENETAQTGYYQVHLDDYNIDVELTVCERAGFHKYQYLGNEEAQVLIDLSYRDVLLESELNIVNSNTISGKRYSNAWASEQHFHFYMEFSEEIKDLVYSDDSLKVGINFGNLEKELLVKVGVSAVDIAGAKNNLETEITNWDFENCKTKTQNAWSNELDKIEIKGGSEEQRTIFYTAMYHSFLNPNLFVDADGRYLGMDLDIHQLENDKHYTVFSLWDTFRATHPLFTITQQERTNQFIRTFLRMHEQGGELPIWELSANYTGCMIGYHSVPVIADAYTKGIRDYDSKLALEAMVNSAMQDKLGLDAYKKSGFIGAGSESESVSKTLEYAYDDWCIAVMADSLGEDILAKHFYGRAQYYKNLYDPESKFFRAKMNNTWFSPFEPSEVNFNYTEANAWQYSLFTPQDIAGHIHMMGGDESYEKHLDDLFTADSNTSGREQADITGLIGQYAHGNEPSHHMAFLYNYLGKAAKTQERVHQILEEQYQSAPDGLSGNEDCGQMSSWYVMSAMGLYSVTPGSDIYALSSPLFEQATINLENGNSFSIVADNHSESNIYIQSAKLNGTALKNSYIKHQDIMKGGELVFELGAEASAWGNEVAHRPQSSIEDNDFVAVPYFISEGQTFTDSLSISIHSPEGGDIFYTIDGSKPNTNSSKYVSEIVVENNVTINAIAVNGPAPSAVVSSEYFKIKGGRSIQINSEYANQYSAAGEGTLIDHLRGSQNFMTGRWQGYREDLNIIIDLGEVQDVNSISLGCLQDIKSWIFYPPKAEFWISEDGDYYISVGTANNSFPDNEQGGFTQDLGVKLSNKKARFVKVSALNYGICPDWHLGAGGATWLFVDEISIE